VLRPTECGFSTQCQWSIEPVGHGAMQSMQWLHSDASTTTLSSPCVIAPTVQVFSQV